MPLGSLVVAVLLLLPCQSQPGPSGNTVTVSLSCGGGWGGADWWFVDIFPNGEGEVTPGSAFTVAPSGMDELRLLLKDTKFFDLQEQYGTWCPDCNFCMLKVKVAEREKTVSVGFVGPDAPERERAEAVRVLEIWRTVKDLAGVAGLQDACEVAP
jgi:hypothetical protein